MKLGFWCLQLVMVFQLFAVTEKDLPKLPKRVKINQKNGVFQSIENPNGVNQEQDFKDTAEQDLTDIPAEVPLGEDEQIQSPDSTAPEEDLVQPNREGPIDETPSLSQPELAPGLKSHKKDKSLPNQPIQAPKPIVLKGVVLFGDEKRIDTLDISGVNGLATDDLFNHRYDFELQKRLNPFIQNLEFNESNIETLRDMIFDFFKEKEIALVDITIPIQDLDSMVLALVVKVAVIDQILVDGNRYLKEDFILSQINLPTQGPIDLRKNQARVDYYNLNPFHQAKLDYKASKEKEGAFDIAIHTGDRFPLRAYVGVDNQGLQLLGPVRSYYGGNLAFLFDIDHVLSFQYTASLDLKKYQSFTGDYRLYTPSGWILRLFGGYVADAYIENGIEINQGSSSQGSFRFMVPWMIKDDFYFSLGVGADYKNTDNNLEYIEYDPVFSNTVALSQAVLDLGINWENSITDGFFSIMGVASMGDLFGNASNSRYSQLRLGAKSHYSYLKADFKSNFYYFRDGYFRFRASGQIASCNLLPSEEFKVGGLQTVRGYIENAVVGDSGFFGSIEWALPSLQIIRTRLDRLGNPIKDGLFLVGFFDAGQTHVKNFYLESKATQPKKATIMSLGPALRYIMEDYVDIEVAIGYKLRRTFDASSQPFVNFSGSVKF